MTPAEALSRTWDLCVAEEWSGWDPYDGLMTRLWPVSLLRRTRLGRLVLIQGVKRSPINLRPFLGVPKHQNPKAVALGLDAAQRLGELPEWRTRAVGEARQLVGRLLETANPTRHGIGWGYPFDWQARAFWIPRRVPTVVCTGFVVRALHHALPLLDDETAPRAKEAIRQAASFVLKDLNRVADDDGFCWSYSALDQTAVVNATLLGAETVARAASVTGDTRLIDEIRPTLRWSLVRQNAEGGWVYGEAGHHQWEDGFHTAFNLVSLDSIRGIVTDANAESEDLVPVETLRRGAEHLATHFFDADGRPWYYRHTRWPVDTHSSAVLILAMLRFRDLAPQAQDRADRCVAWSLENLWVDRGHFAYQIRRRYRVATPFLRWSQAWMLRALAEYAVVRG